MGAAEDAGATGLDKCKLDANSIWAFLTVNLAIFSAYAQARRFLLADAIGLG